jgi:hypothetical protein
MQLKTFMSLGKSELKQRAPNMNFMVFILLHVGVKNDVPC